MRIHPVTCSTEGGRWWRDELPGAPRVNNPCCKLQFRGACNRECHNPQGSRLLVGALTLCNFGVGVGVLRSILQPLWWLLWLVAFFEPARVIECSSIDFWVGSYGKRALSQCLFNGQCARSLGFGPFHCSVLSPSPTTPVLLKLFCIRVSEIYASLARFL